MKLFRILGSFTRYSGYHRLPGLLFPARGIYV